MGHPIRGSSAVIGPDGRILTAAETNNEELVVADLDMNEIVKTKTFADASGHCMCLDLQKEIMLTVLSRQPSRYALARCRSHHESCCGRVTHCQKLK